MYCHCSGCTILWERGGVHLYNFPVDNHTHITPSSSYWSLVASIMLVGQRSIYVYISLYTCPSRCCVLLPVFFGRHVHYSCHCVCVRATRACETARTRSRKQNACLSLLYSVIKVPWLVCTSGVETVFCVCVKTGFFCTMKLMVMPMLCCRCFLVPLCTFRVRKTYGFGKVLTCYVTLTFNKHFFFFFFFYRSFTSRIPRGFFCAPFFSSRTFV